MSISLCRHHVRELIIPFLILTIIACFSCYNIASLENQIEITSSAYQSISPSSTQIDTSVNTQTDVLDSQLPASTPLETTESVAQVADIVTYTVIPTLILVFLLAAALGVFLIIVCFKHAKNRNKTSGVEENKIYKIEDDDSVDSVSLPSSPTNSVLHLTLPYVNTMSHNMTKVD